MATSKTRLNQIIAVSKGAQTAYDRMITDAYHRLQQAALFTGISRTYQPKDDEGEHLPSQSTRVMLSADDLLAEVASTWTRLLNLTATKDWANTQASADVILADGTVIARAVPVTHLIWLEKQLDSIHAVVTRLPVLDPAKDWALNADGVWATPVVQTTKSAKVPFNWVRAEATDKHPAQVDVLHRDIQVGTWNTIDTSGAIPGTRKATLLARVAALQQAVKFAREAGNELEVTDVDMGGPLFAYLLSA